MPYITPANIDDPDNDALVVAITTCELDTYAENRESTSLLGLLLMVRHAASGSNDKTYLSSVAGRFASGNRPKQGQNMGKWGASKGYNRICLFADLKTPGKCFAVILETYNEAKQFFIHINLVTERPAVGGVYLLEEPNPVESYLGSTNSVPVLKRCLRCLPLKMPCHTLIPKCVLSVPSQGLTRYFAMHNLSLTFKTAKFINTTCAGACCDFQRSSESAEEQCGCFSTTHGARMTLCYDVKLPDSEAYSSSGNRFIMDCSSRNTAKLFVTETSWSHVVPTDLEHRKGLREKMKGIETYINDRNGWTVIGWVRTGTVTDASSLDDRDNLASINQRPHISYLYPTVHGVTSTNDYKSLKFNFSPHITLGFANPVAGEEDSDNDSANEEKDDGENAEHLVPARQRQRRTGNDNNVAMARERREEENDNDSASEQKDDGENAEHLVPARQRRRRTGNDNNVAVARRGRRKVG